MTNAFEEERADVLKTAEQGLKIATGMMTIEKDPDKKKVWSKRKKLAEDFIAAVKEAKTQHDLSVCYTAFVIVDRQSP